MSRDDETRVAVASRSFSRHPLLRDELTQRYGQVTFNETGASLSGSPWLPFLTATIRRSRLWND